VEKTSEEEVILSFVIIVDSRAIDLHKCLDSILKQDLESIEILLFINNSNQEIIRIVSEFQELNNRKLKVIKNSDNDSYSILRNKSLLESKGKYLWHFEQNCFLPTKNIASKLINSLQKNITAAICFKYMLEEDFEDLKDINFLKTKNAEIISSQEVLENKNIDSISSFIFERKLGIELNIYYLENENMKINYIFQYQIIKAFHTLSYLDSPLYIKKESINEVFKYRWDFLNFLSDRLNIYFFKETFGKSEKFSIALSQRKKLVSNLLLKKSDEDLPKEFAILLKDIFKIDEKILSNNAIKYKDNFLLDKKYKKSKIDEIFNYLFKETEFVLHLGAHKTATTFIQNIISKNKYDLALEGILFIDLDLFRDYCRLSKNKHIDIKRFILFATLPIMFRLPKRVIISDENILLGTGAAKNKQFQNPYFYCGCSPSGFNTSNLSYILKQLKNCKIFYAFRDYEEYIISRHSEASLFRGYKNLDFLTREWNFSNLCNWSYIANSLRMKVSEFENVSLYFTRYEDYKSNPINFAEILCGHVINKKELSDAESRSIKRYRATKEIIEYMDNFVSIEKDVFKVKRIYRKLLDYGFGSNRYKPDFSKRNFFQRNNKNQNSLIYEEHCREIKLINFDKEYEKLEFKQNKKSFIECSKIKDIERDFIIYSQAEIDMAPINDFVKSLEFRNIEKDERYDFCRSNLNKKKGVTAMLRIKNEEVNIRNVILSIANIFDEIVVVDNGSTDKTIEIIKEISSLDSSIEKKLKIYDYPFNVSRCGIENLNTDKNSLHSLSYFYNYALSKCNYEYVMKWDGDMILPREMINEMNEFLENIITSKKHLLGIPKGITIFKAHNGIFYYKKDTFEAEIRIFKNITQNYFEKDILWERFQSNTDAKFFQSDNPIYIEYKDLNQNEFSHWSIDSLGMSLRKREELKNFKLLSDLTKNGMIEIEELIRNQFEVYSSKII